MDLLNIFAKKTYLLTKYIIISLCIFVKKIYDFINANLKTKYLLVLKIFCFIILCYEGFEITEDFLHYPYVYTFGVEPSQGLDLPPITICTERDVFFDKTRIVRHFNLSREYESYKVWVKEDSNKLYNTCLSDNWDIGKFRSLKDYCRNRKYVYNYL